MDILSTYVIYLALFRLAIIASGIVGIILGYRLFTKGVFPDVNSNPSTDGTKVTAEFANARFTLRNAAPGTCFALFGVIIIAVMFAAGSPEINLELLAKGDVKATVRGDDQEEIQSESARALDYLKQGDNRRARDTVLDSLKSLAPSFNDFAWVLLKSAPELPQTAMLAKIAVAADPQNPNFLGNADAEQISQLEKYAGYTGLAFQVKDDILNVEGDPTLLGKGVGTDKLRQKSTYPSLMGLDASKAFARELIDKALRALESFDDRSDPLRAIAKYIIERQR